MKPTYAPRNSRSAWLTLGMLAAVILAGFALRARGLGVKSFWYDELRQVEVARLPLSGWDEALKLHAARPLDYWITRLLLNYTRSEWLLRFPAILWGTLAIPLVYRLGRRLLGRREGALGALLFAQSALAVEFSQEMRPYGLYALAAAASFWALAAGLRRGSPGAWLLYAFSASVGLLAHYFWLAILASQVVYASLALALGQAPRRRAPAFAACVVAALGALLLTSDPEVVLPLAENYLSAIFAAAGAGAAPAVSLQAEGFNPFAPTLTSEFFLGRLLSQLGAGGGPALLLFNGLLLLGVAGSIRARVRGGVLLARFSGSIPFLLAWLLIGPTLIVSYLLYRNEIFGMRYILFALPAYLLLAARGLVLGADWLGGRLRGAQRARAAQAMIGLGLLSAAWLNARALAEYYRAPKDDWRRVGAFLQANVQPGDAIFAPDVQDFVEYYFPAAAGHLIYADSRREAQYTYAQHARTWFVMSNWVTYDITDTRKVIDLYPGIIFQWDSTVHVKYTHRGRSQAEMAQEAAAFVIPPPSLPASPPG